MQANSQFVLGFSGFLGPISRVLFSQLTSADNEGVLEGNCLFVGGWERKRESEIWGTAAAALYMKSKRIHEITLSF